MLEQERAFVLNGDGQPLGTTKAGRAGYLIRKGKAKLVKQNPLTVQLTYTVENPVVQGHSLGVDDGARVAGVAIVAHNAIQDMVVFKAVVALRGNTKRHLGHRRSRRRGRRSRLRHRQPRSRRGSREGWISPSVRVRKDNILRVVRELAEIAPISRIVYEEGQFDTRVLWDEEVVNYQEGPNSGFENRKKAVLWRDGYRCQYCGVNCIGAGVVAQVDHVIPRSRGGTNAWRNLVCACEPCNRAKGDQTATEFGHPRVIGKIFKYPAHLQTGKTYIKAELSRFAPVKVVFGWKTSEMRKRLRLDKSHTNDAISMAVVSESFVDEGGEYYVIARRRRRDMYNLRHRDGYAGLCHFDVVCWERRDGRRHIGTVRSFVPSRNMVKCRFDFNSNYGVSANRLRLIHRSGRVVYVPQGRKEKVPKPARG
jgi:5-methylcytosine-specific restriction endonuclease McrA